MISYSALMGDACRFYEQHLTDEHRRHLFTRYGLEPWFIEAMRIGYSPPDGSALLLHLMGRGYSQEEIIGSGLVVRWTSKDGTRSGATDLLRGRIAFPYLSADREPVYFIGRQTDESPGTHPAKYIKQRVDPGGNGPKEPIFGSWSVRPGDPLIITEGITDALIVLQSGNPCISPVTTRFKSERILDAVRWCRAAEAPIYIINDSEESGTGDSGAAITAYHLAGHLSGDRVYIGTLPRPGGVEKVDLNDFLRSGGDLDRVMREAIRSDEHPGVQAERQRAIDQMVASIRRDHARQRNMNRREPRRKPAGWIDLDELRTRMPALSTYTGIAPGERGSHPVYGSTHGDNFAVSEDGETWTSFHGGDASGKGGNIFKLIALEQGFMTDERQLLRGDEFIQTIKYCQERWG